MAAYAGLRRGELVALRWRDVGFERRKLVVRRAVSGDVEASSTKSRRALRFHDLRHTYGSLLVAGGVDLASVKAAMGHSRITTTERYLHARSASELAEALASTECTNPTPRGVRAANGASP